MRERFRKDLESYSTVAKQEHADQLQDEKLAHVLGWHLEEAAERQQTPTQTQGRIYATQQKKQEIMRHLKEQLRCLDDPECEIEKKPDDWVVERYDPKRKMAICTLEDGTKTEVMLGDIMTDGEWGLSYWLDPQSVPRNVRKRYLVEVAKRDLRTFLDEQIIASETEGDITDKFKKRAYQAIREHRETPDKQHWGNIAETIVVNLLKKWMHDADLPVDIFEADVFEDVEQKVDFIVHRKQHFRGVDVEASGQVNDVGVQFYGGANPMTEEYKQKQITSAKTRLRPEDRIADIVLMQVPLDEVKQIISIWRKHRSPGGPEAYLSIGIKEQVFRKAFERIGIDETIDSEWRYVLAAENHREERIPKAKGALQAIEQTFHIPKKVRQKLNNPDMVAHYGLLERFGGDLSEKKLAKVAVRMAEDEQLQQYDPSVVGRAKTYVKFLESGQWHGPADGQWLPEMAKEMEQFSPEVQGLIWDHLLYIPYKSLRGELSAARNDWWQEKYGEPFSYDAMKKRLSSNT